MRHVAPGFEKYGKIYAEFRPDNAVVTKTTWHCHYGETKPEGCPGPWYPASLMEDHIAKSSDKAYKRRIIVDGELKWDTKTEYMGDHFGVNPAGKHAHHHLAKYVFVPSPYEDVEETHNHSESKYWANPKLLKKHIKRYHKPKDGPVPERREDHTYMKRVKARRIQYAARVDIHPLAVPLFDEAEVVYFVIEGCLKADSVLSNIRKTGEKAAVLSVPSVSLWNTPEIHDREFFKKYLAGRLVVIIPDGDWFVWKRNEYSKGNKGAVIRQSRFLQTYLATHGIESVVATTPRSIYLEFKGSIKGIDDFIGAGYNLSKMEVNEPTVTYSEIHDELVDRALKGKGKVTGFERDASVLYALSSHALDWQIKVRYLTLARMVLMQGTNPKRPRRVPSEELLRPLDCSERSKALDAERQSVWDAVDSLKKCGAVTVENTLDWRWDPYGQYYDFVEAPTITIAPEFVKPLKLTTLVEYRHNWA